MGEGTGVVNETSSPVAEWGYCHGNSYVRRYARPPLFSRLTLTRFVWDHSGRSSDERNPEEEAQTRREDIASRERGVGCWVATPRMTTSGVAGGKGYVGCYSSRGMQEVHCRERIHLNVNSLPYLPSYKPKYFVTLR